MKKRQRQSELEIRGLNVLHISKNKDKEAVYSSLEMKFGVAHFKPDGKIEKLCFLKDFDAVKKEVDR